MRTPLGQNFLTDDAIAKRIVDSANLKKTDNVLEIGPGKGALTAYLAEKAGRRNLRRISPTLCWKRLIDHPVIQCSSSTAHTAL